MARFGRSEPRARVREYVTGLVRAHHALHAGPGLAIRRQGPGRKRGTSRNGPGMIGYTLPEIRRLVIGLTQRYLPDPDHVRTWSDWR